MGDTLKVDPPSGEPRSSEAPDDPVARVGSVIAGKYTLYRVLGVGGMGAVYEAENTWTGRRVALKVMLPAAARVATAPDRFLREARAASKVTHPHIVEVLDAGQNPSDGALFIVQELLVGTDLRRELDLRHTLPWSEALAVLAPIMDALAAAHRQGIVHRDVKPENVFLATATGTSTRVPKLIDFGIARLIDASDAMHLTHSGALMGTPYYMSPEQARGAREIDARADVWAMGVMIREVLTGERPFAGDNYNALMLSILNDPIRATGEVTSGVPPHAAAAIDRALARDPAERFRDMGEFAEALRQGAEALAQTAPGVSRNADRDALRMRRTRVLPVVLIVLVIALLGVGIARVALVSSRRAPTTPPSLVRAQPQPPPIVRPALTLPTSEPPAPVVAPVAPTKVSEAGRSRVNTRARTPRRQTTPTRETNNSWIIPSMRNH